MPTIWVPKTSDRLQIQFSGLEIDPNLKVEIFDLDLFETSEETIQKIHDKNKRVICYLNAGAWEDWRPDAANYLPEILGNDYAGWPGEKWIDIRNLEKISPILSARLDLCSEKGFDGVEPDNLDGFQTDTGFPITNSDQIEFNLWLAEQAHSRRLAIGLKNDPDQLKKLEPYFDFVLVEDCFQDNFCDLTRPFMENNKAVFAVEYTDRTKTITPYCDYSQKFGLTLFLKNRELDDFIEFCP